MEKAMASSKSEVTKNNAAKELEKMKTAILNIERMKDSCGKVREGEEQMVRVQVGYYQKEQTSVKYFLASLEWPTEVQRFPEF
jgi:hypothetical protein